MAAATSCSSGVLFGARENGAFLGQFDGLRHVEKMHMPLAPTKSHGLVSTSGNYDYPYSI